MAADSGLSYGTGFFYLFAWWHTSTMQDDMNGYDVSSCAQSKDDRTLWLAQAALTSVYSRESRVHCFASVGWHANLLYSMFQNILHYDLTMQNYKFK